MRRAALAALVGVVFVLAGSIVSADEDLRWRRTTPRALVEVVDGLFSLRVPPGRAWGIQSAPLAIEPGRRYQARVRFAVPADAAGHAFLRVALYERADGRGRQRVVRDSLPVRAGEDAQRTVDFEAPTWSRRVKLRLLVRERNMGATAIPVRSWDAALIRSGYSRPPIVILREVN